MPNDPTPPSPPDRPRSFPRDAWRILYRAGVAWDADNAMRLSAAVAMYTILSLSPLLVITIKVTAVVLSEENAARQVRRQAEAFLGPLGAQAVQGMIASTIKPGAGVLATAVSVVLLLVTASGVFNELRDSLNAVWDVAPRAGRGIWASLRDRLLSVGMVFVIGFLLLVSQVVSVSLTVMSEYVIGQKGWAGVAVDLAASTAVIALLFAVLFRVLPDARLSWRDVVFGSVVTAVLFKIGQYLQALYFTYGTPESAYGAAGSFVVVLLWVYYSCWILFYGAELIQERARLFGRKIEPSHGAVKTGQAGTEAQWHGKDAKE